MTRALCFLASAYSMLVDGPRLIYYVNELAGKMLDGAGPGRNRCASAIT